MAKEGRIATYISGKTEVSRYIMYLATYVCKLHNGRYSKSTFEEWLSNFILVS